MVRDRETGRHGDMETWRHGDMETKVSLFSLSHCLRVSLPTSTPPAPTPAPGVNTSAQNTRTTADPERLTNPLRDATASRCRTSWDRAPPALRSRRPAPPP